jgi:hypothetical protein
MIENYSIMLYLIQYFQILDLLLETNELKGLIQMI